MHMYICDVFIIYTSKPPQRPLRTPSGMDE